MVTKRLACVYYGRSALYSNSSDTPETLSLRRNHCFVFEVTALRVHPVSPKVQ